MLAIGDVILRAFNFVILVIALGLTGSLAATTSDHTNPQVNFAVFAAAFGLLTSSVYGVFAYLFAAFAWPLILAVFDFLNLIFTFAAATAIAAAIHVHSCSNDDYVDDNTIAQGSSGRCRKAQGSVAFLYFSFAIFFVSTVFAFISVLKGGLFGTSSKSAPRVGVPTMSQA
ncbi:hypothetical protein PSN45_001165 [Yamadazyma tenuis]|uniref:MARVEL domain-containing protein n=1 Tax=Candida tenuis (strain ATCC 10573 / BCRC 21748 / CBS 615 / JCM 9827 / NBRC 10315 / NRRL Y-1498 / VKM Y-70) TaxID=590646 RepID=G3B8S1_CANTC|nr:uncharacterized protein CANTEDRAFT_115879 [Yamadazyma tenuis ATCC 10573]EGV62417.1 hypothetical protein CANTEDRAFT_115879 [Yamadazyma tenuis ATCC 10573]WEJ93693.1 hypothetical protein PSN45_001165 [Yamadazyma tenuis]